MPAATQSGKFGNCRQVYRPFVLPALCLGAQAFVAAGVPSKKAGYVLECVFVPFALSPLMCVSSVIKNSEWNVGSVIIDGTAGVLGYWPRTVLWRKRCARRYIITRRFALCSYRQRASVDLRGWQEARGQRAGVKQIYGNDSTALGAPWAMPHGLSYRRDQLALRCAVAVVCIWRD